MVKNVQRRKTVAEGPRGRGQTDESQAFRRRTEKANFQPGGENYRGE